MNDIRESYRRHGIISNRTPNFAGYKPLDYVELWRLGFTQAAAYRRQHGPDHGYMSW